LNVTGFDEYDIQNNDEWLKAVFLNYVQQNIKYITKNMYIHNLSYFEVLSENAINKVN